MNKTSNRVSPAELKTISLKVRKFFDSFKQIYTGRERTIDIIMYAMLQKQHTLFFGPPGSAKTAIAESIFSGINSARKFEVQMTAFMAEDAVFGPYNVKKMREEGKLEHNVENMLPEANLAVLDEFLDANPAVLRSLLSSLNERRMVKGRQILDIPLHMAYCSTNVDPYLFLKRNPQALAVFDRISFLDRIDYIQKPEEISEMVKRFQYRSNFNSKETVELSEIEAIADYVLLPPTMVHDELIFLKYGEAIIEYRKRRKEKILEIDQQIDNVSKNDDKIDPQGIIFSEISDRRVCWASQMMEVSAVLDGRINVVPTDMYQAHFILGTSEVEEKIWHEIIDQKIIEIGDLKQNQLSELQVKQLATLKQQFDDIKNNGHDLDTRVNGIGTLVEQIKDIKPENDQVRSIYESLANEADEYREVVKKELLTSRKLN